MIFAYAGSARDEVMIFILSKYFVSSNKNAQKNPFATELQKFMWEISFFLSATCMFLAQK